MPGFYHDWIIGRERKVDTDEDDTMGGWMLPVLHLEASLLIILWFLPVT